MYVCKYYHTMGGKGSKKRVDWDRVKWASESIWYDMDKEISDFMLGMPSGEISENT